MCQAKFNELFIDLRNGPHDNCDYNADSDGDKRNLHVNDLLALLHNSECLEDAFVADEGIKEVWKAHSNQAIRWSLDDGIAQLLKGNKDTALDIYNRIINAEDSEYMEAWNKKATCHYVSEVLILSTSLFETLPHRQYLCSFRCSVKCLALLRQQGERLK